MGIGDSKIEFRRRALELPNCKQEEFHEFLRLATSLDDFFALITAKDIRETLVTSSAVEQLISFACEIVELELLEPSEQKQLLLNAVRFLTRLLPFYFDSESAASPKQPSPLDLRPFVHMVYQLLFIPGFTISSPTACIWERGIGVSKDAPFTEHSNTQLDGNKTEVLRLLLVLLSKQMYRPSESELLAAAVCDLDRQLVLITLCSLLNTITNFQFSSVLPYNHLVFSGSVGTKQELVRSCFHVLTAILNCRFERSPRGSISGLVGSPRGTDDGQLLSPGAQPGGDGSRQQQPQAELKPIIGNMFRHYVSKLHRKQDFDVITGKSLMRSIAHIHVRAYTCVWPSTVYRWIAAYSEQFNRCGSSLFAKLSAALEHDRGMPIAFMDLCHNQSCKIITFLSLIILTRIPFAAALFCISV